MKRIFVLFVLFISYLFATAQNPKQLPIKENFKPNENLQDKSLMDLQQIYQNLNQKIIQTESPSKEQQFVYPSVPQPQVYNRTTKASDYRSIPDVKQIMEPEFDISLMAETEIENQGRKNTTSKSYAVPCNSDDSLSLVELYQVINGSSLGLNWLNGYVYTWDGVSLDSTGYVISLDLSNLGIDTLPPVIAKLSYLRKLFANNNNIKYLPKEIFALDSLRYLNLYSNSLSSIPSEIGDFKSLIYLNLGSNQFEVLPPEIGNILTLRDLYLYNGLLEELPSEIGNLKNLTALYVVNNKLKQLPPEIGNLSNLDTLFVMYNQLTTFPAEIGNLSNLEILLAYNNQISELPPEIGNLKNLKILFLNYNKLTSIPVELTNLDSLRLLTLQHNEITGQIPKELGNMENLEQLSLSNNQITGEIPKEFGNLKNLTRLYLYDNQLSGQIPPELGNLSNLERLLLNSNNLQGTIPAELGNLKKLTYLFLSNNQLEGEIPPEICNLQINYLDLSTNQLTGTVPEELSNNTALLWLLISENNLDSIACDLSGAKNLYLFMLYDNAFDFGDLQNLHIDFDTIAYSGYSPQKPIALQVDSSKASSLYFHFNISGTGNKYQWFNYAEPLINDTLPTLQLPFSDTILINCEIKNPQFPYLTLTTTYYPEDKLDHGVLKQDYQALVALYNSTNGAKWVDNTNWLSDEPVSNWKGISVEKLRVAHISLPYNNLAGNIPAELANLDSLKTLELWANNLTDSLPPELGNLKALTVLDLSNNKLTGPIPPEICNLSKLTKLWLSSNQLTGQIPEQIGNLTELKYFSLSFNQMSGPIPASLGNLTKLEQLWLNSNQFSGTIPSQLGNLPNLWALSLADNQLTGTVPEELGQISSLAWLDLGLNNLDSIACDLSKARFLYVLFLYSNAFDFGDLQNLNVDFDTIAYHSYSPQADIPLNIDTISDDYVKLSVYTDGTGNTYQWFNYTQLMTDSTSNVMFYPTSKDLLVNCEIKNSQFPELTLSSTYYPADKLDHGILKQQYQALVALYDSTDGKNWFYNKNWLSDEPVKNWYGVGVDKIWVTTIYLPSNNLNGTIPAQIGDFDSLEVLYLSNNKLQGQIPKEIGNLKNLVFLNLSSNLLTGSLPAEIGNLTKLVNLYISSNQLSGPIPPQIGNLTQLVNFWGHYNNFSGQLPEEIGNLTKLNYLILGYNQLSGNIPASIGKMTNLYYLYLKNNQLEGQIPDEIGNLSNLSYCYLSNNLLSGQLPDGFYKLKNLRNLALDNNQLEGPIKSIDSLQFLSYLYLNNNNFDSLPDFSAANYLSYIDISNNRLDFADLQRMKLDLNSVSCVYAPQKNASLKIDTVSDKINLTAQIYGQNVKYQWFNGQTPIDNANDTMLQISSSDTGLIFCRAYNDDFPELILSTEAFSPDNRLKNGILTDEYNALVALYNATDGDNWFLNTNWLSDKDVEEWFGITVNSYYVTEIRLNSNNLIGSIPPEIADFDSLKSLVLTDNQLGGPIPPEIGQLTSLVDLYLGVNQFTGTIPEEFENLKNLLNLGLYYNQLSGTFPMVLTKLDSLNYFSLGHNNFYGAVPAEIANLKKLRYMYLYENHFDQLPVLPQNQYVYLRFEANNFDFGDLEPNIHAATYRMVYSPQANVGDTVYKKFVQGQDYQFSVQVDGQYNHYQWIKDGNELEGDTLPNLTLENVQLTDTGTYVCRITNDSLPLLTLWSNPFYLKTNIFDVTFNVTYNGSPVEGALITIGSNSLTTDNNGEAKIELPNGTYTAITYKQGFYTDTVRFTVDKDMTVDINLQKLPSNVQDLDFVLKAYPNPADRYIIVQMSESNVTLELTDLSGKVLSRQKVNSNTVVLGVSRLPAGVYLIRVLSPHGVGYVKFIKQ